jgi:DNA invertase Pin-like site-specific DNA recombinase
MTNIGIYIRKSRESKTQNSLKEQRLLGIEFCKNKYNPIFYDDGIVSGAGSADKRPEFTRMKEDIAEGKLYGIYVWNSDRAARDEIAWSELANLLRDNNVLLFDNGAKADFNDNNTLLLYGMKSTMDAHFTRVTSTKIKAVLKRKANEGKFGGILKYGYKRKKNGKIKINIEEAEVVRTIFQLCIDGNGFKGIADHLNDNNIPTSYNKIGGSYKKDKNLHGNKSNVSTMDKTDAKWVSSVVGKILRSRNYIGEKTYNDEIKEIPRILDLKTFNKAQEQIDKRKNKHGKKSFKKYLLNDILICGNCGKRYTGRKVNKHIYYRCASLIIRGGSCGSAGIRLDYLDNLVWDYFFRNTNLLQSLYNTLKNDNNTTSKKSIQKKIQTFKTTLKSKEKEKANVTKFLLQETLNEDEASQELTRLRKEITDTTLLLEREQESLINLNETANQIEDLKTEIQTLHQKTSFNQKKELIEKYLKEITVINTDGYFTIDLTFKTLANGYIDRFIIDKVYNPATKVNIEQDDEIRKLGYKNIIDFSLNSDEDFAPDISLIKDEFGFTTIVGLPS